MQDTNTGCIKIDTKSSMMDFKHPQTIEGIQIRFPSLISVLFTLDVHYRFRVNMYRKHRRQ